jgi:hypothetical protein
VQQLLLLLRGATGFFILWSFFSIVCHNLFNNTAVVVVVVRLSTGFER